LFWEVYFAPAHNKDTQSQSAEDHLNMSKKTILLTGGSRSGKSKRALALGNEHAGKKYFIATAETLDQEMKDRVQRHKDERGPEWITLEEPLDPTKTMLKIAPGSNDVVLLDCLTLWLSNMLMQEMDDTGILSKVKTLIETCKKVPFTVIVITNEIGAGIVPGDPLSRKFRDLAGEINQEFATGFDEVVHMVSGIPVTIKAAEKLPQESEQKSEPHEFSKEKKKGLYEAIYKRRDMRHFLPDPVDPTVLGRILDAAHHAGSVGFMQPWNFIVIDDPEIKQTMAKNFSSANADAEKNYSGLRKELYQSLKLEGITDSPINLVVTCDKTRNGPHVLGRNTMPETDVFSACCAVQNLWLAARAEGIAVGWVSIIDPERLKQDLGLPENIEIVAYLCVGHTQSFYKKPMLESAGWGKRLALKNLVYYNRWKGTSESYTLNFPD